MQHLSNWQSMRDNVGVSILTKLKRLSTSHQIHLQWISSHIDLERNEIADTLAKAGTCEVPEPSAPLTFSEIFSRTKHQNTTAWITSPPPEHHWYQCSRPGGSLAHGFARQDQTLLARFQSGHLKTMKFSERCKSFKMCTNCSEPASPAQILKCLGLTKQGLADDPLLVLDFLKVYDVMDLVTADQWGRATTTKTRFLSPQRFYIGVGFFANTIVHVIMYFYYGLAACGSSVRKYLWWKKYLTLVQITQIFFIAAYMGVGFLTGCEVFGAIEKLVFTFVSANLILFVNFYRKYKM
ncbi:RNase H domain-containing protein [Trichonephila clavipes]|nr:RNase H domain-containing protein [Trichonephila clavipes]